MFENMNAMHILVPALLGVTLTDLEMPLQIPYFVKVDEVMFRGPYSE